MTRQLAEDLQDSAARVIDKPNHAPPDEGIVPWFYRVLRNSAIDDRRRRRGTAARALEACARKLEPMTPLSLSWRLKFAGA